MLRRVTMAAVVAVVAAAMAAPAAFAQDDYSTTQVEYGQDVYGGTEGGTEEEAATGSAGQTGGAWTKFSAKLSGDNEVGGGDPDGSGTAAVKTRGTGGCYDLKGTGVDVTIAHIHKGAGGPMSKGLMLLGLCVIAAGSTLLAVGQRRRVAYHRPRH